MKTYLESKLKLKVKDTSKRVNITISVKKVSIPRDWGAAAVGYEQ
jgi:hypothetical protein